MAHACTLKIHSGAFLDSLSFTPCYCAWEIIYATNACKNNMHCNNNKKSVLLTKTVGCDVLRNVVPFLCHSNLLLKIRCIDPPLEYSSRYDGWFHFVNPTYAPCLQLILSCCHLHTGMSQTLTLFLISIRISEGCHFPHIYYIVVVLLNSYFQVPVQNQNTMLKTFA